jgi:RES domain-containing protein
MYVYRVVQGKKRVNDISGTGAFTYGGRWNSRGVYMLYTSTNSSLALLENIVHYDPSNTPPNLYLLQLEVNEKAPIINLQDDFYPSDWRDAESPVNKQLGDRWMNDMRYLAVGVKSAVNELELNYLINPLFPDYNKLVKIVSIKQLPFDKRLLKK